MEELYLIMENLLKVEYKQKALLNIFQALENFYSEDEQEEIKLLVSTVKWSLESLQEEMKKNIKTLDSYLTFIARKEK